MSGTIWLITEDESDKVIVEALVRKKGFDIQVARLKLTGGSGGVDRLAHQLERLIRDAKDMKKPNDCIVVLHDADIHMQQSNRQTYEQIRRICKDNKVTLILARDEIEAWLLADSGICKWLGIRPRNHDEETKPKDKLNSLLDQKHNMKYRERNQEKILAHLNGDGDTHSPSMQEALQHLEDAPCTK